MSHNCSQSLNLDLSGFHAAFVNSKDFTPHLALDLPGFCENGIFIANDSEGERL